jgi:hypothetical protein
VTSTGAGAPKAKPETSKPETSKPETPQPKKSVKLSKAPADAAAAIPAQTAAMTSTPVARPQAPTAAGRGNGPAKKPSRDALPLPIRLGAWLLAIPLGLILIGVPSRKLGYLTGQKMLDVIVKHDLARFVPLLVIVALWALATAILVEAFCEGGRWWMLRRRRRTQEGGGGNGFRPVSPRGRGPGGVTFAPPAPRPRGSVPARRGH